MQGLGLRKDVLCVDAEDSAGSKCPNVKYIQIFLSYSYLYTCILFMWMHHHY